MHGDIVRDALLSLCLGITPDILFLLICIRSYSNIWNDYLCIFYIFKECGIRMYIFFSHRMDGTCFCVHTHAYTLYMQYSLFGYFQVQAQL